MRFSERTNFSQNEITTKIDTLSLLNGTKINHHDKIRHDKTEAPEDLLS